MIHLPGVLSAAETIQDFCRKLGWKFCLIGGVAVQRWGEPRLTQDVDLTLLTGFGDEEKFADALLQQFEPRRSDAREFALVHRVLLLRASSGIPLDIAFGALPFEQKSIERASSWVWSQGRELFTCSAEDLVVHKIFAGRPLDWFDAERTLVRQFGKLNLQQVRSELLPLLELKGELVSLEKLDLLTRTVNRRLSAS